MSKPTDVPGYIAGFPPPTRKLLRQLRSLIRKTVHGAEEKIGYGIPGYGYHGMLVYFAGYERHIGFYTGSRAILKFAPKLKSYKTAKGTVQFPLDRPLPIPLIKEMILWIRGQNEAKAAAKKTR